MVNSATSGVLAPGATALIVYEHELLGEGIAARLRDRGVATTVLARPDGATMSDELAKHPSVIIAEWTTPECLALMGQLSPQSRIVDVGNVIGRGFPDSADLVHFSAILDALASA